MTLGEWIDTLREMPAEAYVVMDCGTIPTNLCSWRGAYEELTLHNMPSKFTEGFWPTEGPLVKELLGDAIRANGRHLEGYKGGDFLMSRRTPVWADPYGECNHRVLAGVVLSGEKVILRTYVAP